MDNLPRLLPAPSSQYSISCRVLTLPLHCILFMILSQFPQTSLTLTLTVISVPKPTGLLAVPQPNSPLIHIYIWSHSQLSYPHLYIFRFLWIFWCFFMWFFHPPLLLDHCLLLCSPIILPSYISKLKIGFYSTLLAGSLRAETFSDSLT